MAVFYYSEAEAAAVALAVDMQATAPDNQLHASVVEQLAPAAVATTLWGTAGDFANECRDKPLGTLLKWIEWHVNLSTQSELN